MGNNVQHASFVNHTVQQGNFPARPSRMRAMWGVMGWELRRRFMSKVQWILLFALIGLCFLLLVVSPYRGLLGGEILIPASSPLGIMQEIPGFLLFLFLLFLPFLMVDLVAYDYTRRTHELLMATSISKSAYLWGRYLAGLLICLIMSAIMLLEVILANFLSYAQLQFYPGLLSSATVAQAPGYPPLDAGFLVTIWIVAVVPAVVLLSGISFFLGTIFPQRSNTIKAIILVAWVLFFALTPQILMGTLSFFDPTGASEARTALSLAVTQYQAYVHPGTGLLQHLNIARNVEVMKPDIITWSVVQGIYTAFGIVLVLCTPIFFRRFRTLLG
ncbi:MAG TPA: hypothetical protein VKV20_00610 [Ktedonobacteraceae bacterium]|jgi:ABC-type transport system involved in multi-copper enzyme maturation permease subunit|nr:hypothetical protein [Ktedonobacteraceae bacterium]